MSSKKAEEEKQRDERIEQTGQLTLEKHGEDEKAIHMITIIGEIEGHDNLGSSSKTTKYEHILPQLAAIEDSSQIEGLLVLLNTMGGAGRGLRAQGVLLLYHHLLGASAGGTDGGRHTAGSVLPHAGSVLFLL